MIKNVAIIHYNTPELTSACIDSLLRSTPDCRVIVFDNSDKYRFPLRKDVTVIDNTTGDIINFERLVSKYPNRRRTVNNHASSKHIASVDYLFDILKDGFVLLDSDVLIKKDISVFFDEQYAWVGEIDEHPEFDFQSRRLLPFLLYINVPMLAKYGIRFWHEGMSYKLSHRGVAPFYDTGGSLLFDCDNANLPSKELRISEYIEHFGGASYSGKPWRVWLDEHETLYTDMEESKISNKDRILVVIPYCSQGAQGRELEYAVAGWRKHFKENYLIVIAGEYHPIVETGDDIVCVESVRVEPKEGMYRQHLDYVSCFRKVHKQFPDSKGFIFVADDVYAVNDFDMVDVMFLKQKASNLDDFNPDSTNKWKVDKARTRELLKREGYPTRNFTTHLPQYFEWDKIEKLWDKYDMDNVSYVIEDLYYNIYYPTRIPLQIHIDHDNVKCGVYRSNPCLEYISNAFRDKIWLQNSPEGWIEELEKALMKHYGM